MSFIVRQGRALLLAAVLVVGAVCVSNGDNPSNLVGQWVEVKTGEKIELFKDGTGVIGSKDLTWKTEGKRFMLSFDGSSSVRDYNLSGYELTRTDDDGKTVVWVRKNNVEEYKKKENKKIDEEMQRLEKMSGYFTDSRDSMKYRTVKVGGKTWMAENLLYVPDKVPDNAWCYGGNSDLCATFGGLYDWNTAMTVCPKGWHLPSREEWDRLAESVGGTKDEDGYGWDGAGKKLKSIFYWEDNGGGTDTYGFSALPGGEYNYNSRSLKTRI